MSVIRPHFWRNPLKYCKWAANERPAQFFSIVIGSIGPIALVASHPIKKYFGIKRAPEIPMTYPIPKGPRQIPEGYDDP